VHRFTTWLTSLEIPSGSSWKFYRRCVCEQKSSR